MLEQTVMQNPDSTVLGSAKVEISKDQGQTWQDLGVMRNVQIKFQGTNLEVKADNGLVPLKGQFDRKVNIEFSLLERHLPTLYSVLEGLVNLNIEKGEQKEENLTINNVKKNSVFSFPLVNFDNSLINVTSIKDKDIALVAGNDYTVTKWGNESMLVFLDTKSGWKEGDSMLVTYEVTPAKSYTMLSSAQGILKPLAMQITNIRQKSDGTTISRIWHFWHGTYAAQDQVQFKTDSDADPLALVPMTFLFEEDPSRLGDANSLYEEIQEV